MSEVHAIILGIIQGLTEFIPVSSSAHLVLLPQIFGWQDQGHAMDVFVTIGTTAVLFLFFKDFHKVIFGSLDILKFRSTNNSKLVINILLASIPAIVFLGLIEVIIGPRLKSPLIICASTFIFALMLFLCDGKSARINSNPTTNDCIIVGLFQILSVIPGASRLGVCISVLRFLGYSREQSFRFSLLLSIPPSLGAVFLKGIKVYGNGIEAITNSVMIASLFSFIFGIISLKLIELWLKRGGTFLPFVIYRIVLAVCLAYFY